MIQPIIEEVGRSSFLKLFKPPLEGANVKALDSKNEAVVAFWVVLGAGPIWLDQSV